MQGIKRSQLPVQPWCYLLVCNHANARNCGSPIYVHASLTFRRARPERRRTYVGVEAEVKVVAGALVIIRRDTTSGLPEGVRALVHHWHGKLPTIE